MQASSLAPLLLVLAGLLHASAASESLLQQAQRSRCGGACPQLGATARLALFLHGAGSHRHLEYRLEARCPPADGSSQQEPGADGASPPPLRPCADVALLQPLPAAVFADVYQLDNAAAVGQGPAVHLFGPVDVESIERYSQPTLLEVYAACIGGNRTAEGHPGSVNGEATVVVPLHARYPHPREQQHQQSPGWLAAAASAVVTTELPPPLVLIRCPAGGSGGKAGWQIASYEAQQPETVRWDIPAGNLQHGALVVAGTAAAVGCGAAAVLLALFVPLAAGKLPATRRQKRQ